MRGNRRISRQIDVLFCGHSGFGGASVSLKNLLLDAKGSGFRVGLAARSREAAEQICGGMEVPLWHLPLGTFEHHLSRTYRLSFRDAASIAVATIRYVLSSFPLLFILWKSKTQILYLNSSVLIPYALVGKLAGVRVVIHVRERVAPGRRGFRRYVLRRLANRCTDCVVYIGEEERAAFPLRSPSTLIVHNYVRSGNYQEAIPSDFVFKKRPLRVLSMGGDVSLKGGPELEAAARALQDSVQIVLLGCAASPDAEAQSHKDFFPDCPGKAVKIRHVEAVQSFLAWADVVVFWARTPHFPRPVLEAWMAGRPVLVSRSGAATSLLNNGTYVVAADDDLESLLQGLKYCMEQYPVLQGWVAKNRELALELFSERNFAELSEALHALLS
jgi:glycosyltransferase involved in cell wall biosynthesis